MRSLQEQPCAYQPNGPSHIKHQTGRRLWNAVTIHPPPHDDFPPHPPTLKDIPLIVFHSDLPPWTPMDPPPPLLLPPSPTLVTWH